MTATPNSKIPVPAAPPDRSVWSVRREMALAGHRGDADTARGGLDHPDAGVRATALGALGRMGDLTEDELRRALTDDSPLVRRRAAVLAVGRGGRHGVSLLPLLDDEDPFVAEAAAFATGECDPPEPGAVERLVELAGGHEDPLVRESAVAALGSLADERGLRAILAATRDKSTVRRRAALALAPFEGPEVDEALSRLLEDRDWQVRQAAEDLLGGPTDEAD